jgi:hypothetical protein
MLRLENRKAKSVFEAVSFEKVIKLYANVLLLYTACHKDP